MNHLIQQISIMALPLIFAVTLHDIGRQGDHPYLLQPGGGFDLSGHRVAIHLRQVDVHQDQIRFAGQRLGNAFPGVSSLDHRVALDFQHTLDEYPVIQVVFDVQDCLIVGWHIGLAALRQRYPSLI